MANSQWVLKIKQDGHEQDGQYLITHDIPLSSVAQATQILERATKFDWRDDRKLKTRYFTSILRVNVVAVDC